MTHTLRVAAWVAAFDIGLALCGPAWATDDGPSPGVASAPAAAPGSLVAFVKRTKPPKVAGFSAGLGALGAVGGLAASSGDGSMVTDNGIEDPSGDMARQIAGAYVAAHGGQVAATPLADDHPWTQAKAGGARYVVDVETPAMMLMYFSFDWAHYDLTYYDAVKIIDTTTGSVVAKARCSLDTNKANAATKAELSADHAARLKALIASKSEECLDHMKTSLKL